MPKSPEEFRTKWASEADRMRRRGALVNGAALCDEILRDFDRALTTYWDQALNLQRASAESGYSAGHLGRLVREGSIPNCGRPKAPLIRRKDLPRKPSSLHPQELLLTLREATPGQIARAVVNPDQGEAR